MKSEAKVKRKEAGKEKSKITRAENKKKRIEHMQFRDEVLSGIKNQKIRDSIYKVEDETNVITPMFKLKKLAEKHGI